MKAIKYKTIFFDEANLEDRMFIGGGHPGYEIFIPTQKLCFNIEPRLNIFRANEPKDTQEVQEIEIPDSIGKRLSLLLKSIERIDKTKEGLLKEIKKVGILEEKL